MIKHSIFNDVLGPIMSGPSSSHSAGCARIGLMTQKLYGKDINKANIIFDENGSYPETYIGQGSNFGFTGGLLGYPTHDPKIKDSVEIATAMGKNIWFSKKQLFSRHPNEALINVYDENNNIALSVLTFSTGGGMFEIIQMDNFPVFIDGSKEQLFVCVKSKDLLTLKKLLENIVNRVTIEEQDNRVLFSIVNFNNKEEEIKKMLKKHRISIIWIRKAPVILPTEIRENYKHIFSTANEALKYSGEMNKEIWELAIDYELAIGKSSSEQIWETALQTLRVMRASIIAPNPKETPLYGFLPYKSQEMRKNLKKIKSVDTGVLCEATISAISVMENNCAHNIVVAAPTAGSSGVLPATIISIGESMSLPEDEIIKGLLAAGLIGSFIANEATFGAEVAACQAEIGAASCMAAAGVVQLLGGTIKQCFQAASMAMQNMLGLICDPVGGLTEIPCISRNVSAVSNAIMSANMVMWGFDPVIPLDESIETMLRVGKELPASLRCTCKGGLCTTNTAMCIVKKIRNL